MRRFPAGTRLFPLLALLAATSFLASCGDGSDKKQREEAELAAKSAEDLYLDARIKLSEREYKLAVKAFDDVERLHPYSEWAARSQIMSAYTSYRATKYDDAILTLERFTKLHPGHESASYAYYLIAMCYYEQISDVGRDQGLTQKAQASLKDVIARFPDSDYARDSRLKLDLVADHLAGKEMMIGRYYLKQQEYLAAANRFRVVIDSYQTTSHVPEALHRMVEVYLNLGVKEEARRYAAVLGHNFPASEWYRRSYALLEEKGVTKPDTEQGFFESLF